MLCLGLNGPPYIHIRKRPYYPRLQLRDWARLQVSEVRYSSREPRPPPPEGQNLDGQRGADCLPFEVLI